MDKIGIIGLGYVGLPLAVAFAENYETIGFDINNDRIKELNSGRDSTLEIEDELLQEVLSNKEFGLKVSSDINDIADCNIYLVTVPTPIDKNNRPVLTPLYKASETVGKVMSKGDIVIYESTVYPGATEEECVPVLEKFSGMKFNKDFYVGYSPERINPGDKEHTVRKIKKVTSGSTPEIGKKVDELYRSVITAGTFLASSIKVAEAAKVIENSQRDINIAFVNELHRIFTKMNINTKEVLDAAATKWNFIKFQPGLVGGHCIGVDPYYLAQKAQEIGYNPEIILAGRRMNDTMAEWYASDIVKRMIKKEIKILRAKVLILGITFKENCPDIRNTKVIDLIDSLKDYGCEVSIYDPWADKKEVKDEYGIDLIDSPKGYYDVSVLAVAHNEFKDFDVQTFKNREKAVLYDIKGIWDK